MKKVSRKRLEEAIIQAMGYLPEAEIIEEALAEHAGLGLPDLESEMENVERELNARGGHDIELAERLDSLCIAIAAARLSGPPAKKKKKVQKPFKLDPVTVAWLRSQKKCFHSDHAAELERLSKELERVRSEVAMERQAKEEALTQKAEILATQAATMVNKEKVEEAEKSGHERGYLKGAIEKEDELAKKKACFDDKHKRLAEMTPVSLSFDQILALYEQMISAAASAMIYSPGSIRVTVLLPPGMVVPRESQLGREVRSQFDKIVGRILGSASEKS